MADSVDDTAEQAPTPPKRAAGTGIFDRIGGSIDDLVGVVKAIPKVAKKAAHYTYYTAKAALGCAAGFAIGGAPALIVPAGMALGTALCKWKNNEPISFEKIANDIAIGGLLGGLASIYFKGANLISDSVQAAYGTKAALGARLGLSLPYVPTFLAQHEYLNRVMIKDYEPIPLNNMWKQLKGPMKWVMPLVFVNFGVVPYYFDGIAQQTAHLTLSSTNTVLYGLIREDSNDKENKNKDSNTTKLPNKQYQMPNSIAA